MHLFQKLDDEENIETKATQLIWDIMFTTDPEVLSDGYRVQFQRVIDHETGEEKIIDVIVEHANLGVGLYRVKYSKERTIDFASSIML